MSKLKQYLGDGVSADLDGHSIILTTKRHKRLYSTEMDAYNMILLGPSVYEALLDYVAQLKKPNVRKVCCCCSKQIVEYNCHPNDKYITSGPGIRMCGNDWCCNECSKDLDEKPAALT